MTPSFTERWRTSIYWFSASPSTSPTRVHDVEGNTIPSEAGALKNALESSKSSGNEMSPSLTYFRCIQNLYMFYSAELSSSLCIRMRFGDLNQSGMHLSFVKNHWILTPTYTAFSNDHPPFWFAHKPKLTSVMAKDMGVLCLSYSNCKIFNEPYWTNLINWPGIYFIS